MQEQIIKFKNLWIDLDRIIGIEDVYFTDISGGFVGFNILTDTAPSHGNHTHGYISIQERPTDQEFFSENFVWKVKLTNGSCHELGRYPIMKDIKISEIAA